MPPSRSEHERRVVVLVHTAMLASVGVCAVALVLFRSEIAPGTGAAAARGSLFLLMSALGIAQFAGATIAGGRLLKSGRSDALNRVRLYFLLRAGAAEAIALYGFALGLLRGPFLQVAGLFAIGVAALCACAPSRAAWEAAVERAGSGAREPGNRKP